MLILTGSGFVNPDIPVTDDLVVNLTRWAADEGLVNVFETRDHPSYQKGVEATKPGQTIVAYRGYVPDNPDIKISFYGGIGLMSQLFELQTHLEIPDDNTIKKSVAAQVAGIITLEMAERVGLPTERVEIEISDKVHEGDYLAYPAFDQAALKLFKQGLRSEEALEQLSEMVRQHQPQQQRGR